MVNCQVCRKEKPEDCGDCAVTAAEAGTLEILWDGLVAMAADVRICRDCDGAWLCFRTRNAYICARCRRHALHVRIVPKSAVA
jgi:hypothetical protein